MALKGWHVACCIESKETQQPILKEVIMAATYIEIQKTLPVGTIGSLAVWRDRIIEGFWFSICLSLFVILGPFSAPIVLGYLMFNNHLQSNTQEPESLNS